MSVFYLLFDFFPSFVNSRLITQAIKSLVKAENLFNVDGTTNLFDVTKKFKQD